MKKNIKALLIIVIVAACVWGINDFIQPKYKVKYKSDTNTGQPVTFQIDTKQFGTHVDFDKVTINLYHKYKKDEKVNSVIEPFTTGEYQFTYYPVIAGKCEGTITFEKSGKTYSQEIELNVA